MSNPDYSTLYTFLPISKALPDCPYEILDTVMMLMPETAGVAAAYAVAGKTGKIPLMSDGATLPRSPLHDLTPMPCDPWADPNDYENPSSICDDAPPPAEPPTSPQSPLRPAEDRPMPNTVSFNGCVMNTDDNYPSGRITVEETQWGSGAREGVADVRIEVLGPNGQRVIAYTNRYGCFKATGAIRGYKIPRPFAPPSLLPVILNVIFKSDRKEIRGLNRTVPYQYTKPLLHIWGNIADRMNNADVHYDRQTGIDDEGTKQYVAATVNNALYDFDEYAAQDGILPPPDNIKILVTCFAEAASAPMLHDLKSRNVWDAAAIGNYLNTRVGGLGGILAPSAPDIIIGYKYDGTSSADFATDKIKETAYHEFAHASHYRKTTTEMWIENIRFIANYGVGSGNIYGNAGDPGVERTDLIEMWGYFMGREYAHRRYGPNAHSPITSFFTNPGAPTFENSWYAAGENGGTNRRLFDWVHIPSYFLNDILDNNMYNTQRSLVENPSVAIDSISNFKIASIYGFLDGSTTSPTILMNKLADQIPSNDGNNIANFNLLRSYYGY
ncbi:hypothetical protein [Niabella aquatica]